MTAADFLIRSFLSSYPVEMAAELEKVSPTLAASILDDGETIAAAQTLASIGKTKAHQIIPHLSTRRLGEFFSVLDAGLVASLLRGFDLTSVQGAFSKLNKAKASQIKTLLQYPENTAGAIADASVVAIPTGLNVAEAIDQIESGTHTTIDYVYVVNRARKLEGVLKVSLLFRAERTLKVDGLMHKEVVTMSAMTNIDGVISHPGWQLYHALPVVDEAGRFLGAMKYSILQKIIHSKKEQAEKPISSNVAAALGELYGIGLSSFGKVMISRLEKKVERGE